MDFGGTLVHTDPRAAITALEESIAITDAGGSDVMLSHALGNASVATAALGRTDESLAFIRRSVRHSVFCGDIPSTIYALRNGLAVISGFAEPELLVAWSATMRLPGGWIGGAQHEVLEAADARAAERLSHAHIAEIAALTFDEAVERILRVRRQDRDELIHYSPHQVVRRAGLKERPKVPERSDTRSGP